MWSILWMLKEKNIKSYKLSECTAACDIDHELHWQKFQEKYGH